MANRKTKAKTRNVPAAPDKSSRTSEESVLTRILRYMASAEGEPRVAAWAKRFLESSRGQLKT